MTRRVIRWVLALEAIWLPAVWAQVSADLAVEASANVQKTPPKITLTWPSNAQATGYAIYRKQFSDTSWGNPIANIGAVTSWADTNVVVGASYEYQVVRLGGLGG